jgi:excisionase family DNA binding protein
MSRPQTSPRIRGGATRRPCDLVSMSTHNQEDPAQAQIGLLDAADVAEMLRVPTTWVYAEARAGRLPHVRVGRYRRFRRQAIEQWIDEHEKGPAR